MSLNEALSNFGYADLGASTFVASAHPSESCGSNGLPLTPNSVKILGRSQRLYSITHPHLCNYVHVQRGKHERVVVIQEYYHLNLQEAWRKYDIFKTEKKLLQVAFEVLQGLEYLSLVGINCCYNICPSNIIVDPFGHSKLYNYGLYYMTEMGTAVSFPIGGVYSAPEALVACPAGDVTPDEVCGGSSASSNPTIDVWGLGCILLQFLVLKDSQGDADVELDLETFLMLVAEQQYEDLVSGLIAHHPHLEPRWQKLSSSTQELLNNCLQLSPLTRATPSQLLSHSAFDGFHLTVPLEMTRDVFPPPFHASSSLRALPPASQILADYPLPADFLDTDKWGSKMVPEGLRTRCIREVYHLWRLAGGQAEQELAKHGLIRTHPPILTLPSVAVVEGELLGGQFHRLQLQQPSEATLALSLHALQAHLAHIPLENYYPIITKREYRVDDAEVRNLPLVIRERDVEYQFHRMLLFHRLLKAYPCARSDIVREAGHDIAPYWRGLIWAALLGVDGFVHDNYAAIDKVTPTSTDRQIEVDIPRCHQYDELLSSPQAHLKFTRLLKAWVVSHPGLVYWQGLDSLTAPFLYLNFNNEALAYACLSAFIDKYLHKFFLRDNSAVIQEYLAKFSHLIAFHDPSLYSHLATIGFVPELYAIPWFLTMYTHVFPLSQIFHVWDTLLLHPACLALCVAAAILRHLRHQLLNFSFNDCILLFSDMPDINIEVIVSESVQLLQQTPASLTFRHHAPHDTSAATTAHASLGLQPALLTTLSDLSSISLAEQRGEVCGRVSAADLLVLLSDDTSPAALVIDTRPQHMFQSGSLVSAWNIPGEAWLPGVGPEVEAPSHPTLREIKDRARDRIVVVMGTKAAHHATIQVCEQLVSGGVARVCALHGGVEVFQLTGRLVVASSTPN